MDNPKETSAPLSQWSGTDSEGDQWSLEIEVDCFSEDDPFVVTVWAENKEDGEPKETGLAQLSPAQAREAAKALLWWADNCQFNRDRVDRAA